MCGWSAVSHRAAITLLSGLLVGLTGLALYQIGYVGSVPLASRSGSIASEAKAQLAAVMPGHTLWLGSSTGPLMSIDLDQGHEAEFPVAGWPVMGSDSGLVILRPDQSVVLVDARDPTIPIRDLGRAPFMPGGVRPGGDDHLWMLDPTEPHRWALINLQSGETVEQYAAAPYVLPSVIDGPKLTSRPQGGVYTMEGTTPAKVHDGQPVAASPAWVLADCCDKSDACDLVWLERETWTEVERPLPPEPVVLGARLTDDGRFLAFDRPGNWAGIFDVVANQMLEVKLADLTQLAASPDGRWLAFSDGGLVVYDSATGTTFDLGKPLYDDYLMAITPK